MVDAGLLWTVTPTRLDEARRRFDDRFPTSVLEVPVGWLDSERGVLNRRRAAILVVFFIGPFGFVVSVMSSNSPDVCCDVYYHLIRLDSIQQVGGKIQSACAFCGPLLCRAAAWCSSGIYGACKRNLSKHLQQMS